MWHQSIAAALQKADRRWTGTRGRKSQISQLRMILATLRDHFGHTDFKLDDITVEVVQKCVERWRDLEFSTSTIRSRLSILFVMVSRLTAAGLIANSRPNGGYVQRSASAYSRIFANQLSRLPMPGCWQTTWSSSHIRDCVWKRHCA